jgi:hypothetical protein
MLNSKRPGMKVVEGFAIVGSLGFIAGFLLRGDWMTGVCFGLLNMVALLLLKVQSGS